MRLVKSVTLIVIVTAAMLIAPPSYPDDGDNNSCRNDAGRYDGGERSAGRPRVHLGRRPYLLVEGMRPSRLKRRLMRCIEDSPRRSDFSIGHRGAPMAFPEHTRESYLAAARQGAGIIECDVNFTRDGELVCRHDECDLHRTTDILERPEIAQHCTTPWHTIQDAHGNDIGSTAKCCTSDITLSQFRKLEGRMDGIDEAASSIAGYMTGTGDWRNSRYDLRGTVMTHRESIDLIDALGAKFAPELKQANPERLAAALGVPVDSAQATYARKMIEEYEAARIPPRKVWAQSFNLDDVLFWIEAFPRFGRQAVYLDDSHKDTINSAPFDRNDPATWNYPMDELADTGVRIVGPPMFFLLDVRNDGEIVPSTYARLAKKAGLEIVSWTFEREDIRNGTSAEPFYYAFDDNPNVRAIETASDMYEALDVLARKVGIIGMFSDWPATVTYYANCMGLD